MSEKLKFYGLRYFVSSTQMKLDLGIDSKKKPSDIYVVDIITNRNKGYEYRSQKYKFTVYPFSSSDRFILGYLLKHKPKEITDIQGAENEPKISMVTNWERVIFLLDKENQCLLVQSKNSAIEEEVVKNALTGICNQLATNAGYQVRFEYIVQPEAFWNVIEEARGIIQVSFDLDAPNLFGSRMAANELMKQAKENYNISSAKIELTNVNAKLNLVKEREEFEKYREYADNGGGTWSLKVIMDGKKPRRFHSKKFLKKEESPIKNDKPNWIKSNLESVKEVLIQVIGKIDKL